MEANGTPPATPPDDSWVTMQSSENRRNCPPEYLEPFRGKQVAWNWEGTEIVA